MNNFVTFDDCPDQLICKYKKNVGIGDPLLFFNIDLEETLYLHFQEEKITFDSVYAVDTRKYNGEIPSIGYVEKAVEKLRQNINLVSDRILKYPMGHGENQNCVGGTYMINVDQRCASFKCYQCKDSKIKYLHVFLY